MRLLHDHIGLLKLEGFFRADARCWQLCRISTATVRLLKKKNLNSFPDKELVKMSVQKSVFPTLLLAALEDFHGFAWLGRVCPRVFRANGRLPLIRR